MSICYRVISVVCKSDLGEEKGHWGRIISVKAKVTTFVGLAIVWGPTKGVN